MSRLDILVASAIDVCTTLNSFMPTLISTVKHTRTTADSLGDAVEREVGALRAQILSLKDLAAATETRLEEGGQAASEALEDVAEAAGALAKCVEDAVDDVADGGESLEHFGEGAQEDIDAQLRILDTAAESLNDAAESLSDMVSDARAEVGAQLSLQILEDAIDGLKFGQEMWEAAQSVLYEAIGTQAREVAHSLANAADTHARELVNVVNGLIDDCNGAAQSVYASMANAVPNRTADAYENVGETLEELTTIVTAKREAQVEELELKAGQLEAAVESAFASIAPDLAPRPETSA